MVETAFVLNLRGRTDRLRVRFSKRRAVVDRFTVQYEATVEGRVYSVVRYDSSHGEAHRDTLGWDGSVVKKDWFPGEPYGVVLTNAIADVKTNWRAYRLAFERRKP